MILIFHEHYYLGLKFKSQYFFNFPISAIKSHFIYFNKNNLRYYFHIMTKK